MYSQEFARMAGNHANPQLSTSSSDVSAAGLWQLALNPVGYLDHLPVQTAATPALLPPPGAHTEEGHGPIACRARLHRDRHAAVVDRALPVPAR